MLNIQAQFHYRNKCQILVMVTDSLYCDKCEKFQNHAVTFQVVPNVKHVRDILIHYYYVQINDPRSKCSGVTMFTVRQPRRQTHKSTLQMR